MSDSEEIRPGASSALLTIASAYSDSDSSQENEDSSSPQKSLGSLVENLRAEAKRSEGENNKLCEEPIRIVSTPANISLDVDKSQSVTKIVRLDSGKVVKIRTSSGSKATEFRNEDSHSKSGINSIDAGIEHIFSNLFPPASCSEDLDKTIRETRDKSLVDSVRREVKTDIDISNESETRIPFEVNKFELNSNLDSEVNIANHPRIINIESITVENYNAMGIKSTKEEVKEEDNEITTTRTVEEDIPHGKKLFGENPEVERLQNPIEHSNTLISGNNLVIPNDDDEDDDDDDIQEITPVNIIKDTTPECGLKIKQNEESEQKTESTILNAYLLSKQAVKVDVEPQMSVDVKNYDTNRNPEIVFRGGHGNLGKTATAGSVVVSNRNINIEREGFLVADESIGSEEDFGGLLDVYEVKPRPELKPLPRLERLKVKSPIGGLENQLKKTEQELQASSPTLYKMLESCESATIPEIKKGAGPAPIKLKRNFSCLSTTSSNIHPEKKFIPEPSESARITPSDCEMSPDLPVIPVMPEVTIRRVEAHSQEEERIMKSPTGMQMSNPSRSPVSSNFQQVSAQQYQPSFTNMINTSPNQVSTLPPLKKSPQPITPQVRITRRDEQKRTLPLILRKAEVSITKIRDPNRVEETRAKVPSIKDEGNTSLKMSNERELSIEIISSESQEQSASVPFSNSSSNQENSNFTSSINFENVIDSGTTSKESETPLSEDAGSDNARPPPTPTKEELDDKQPTSFLSQPAETTEMPTIIIPKKRGRPRKFPLPEKSTLVGTWPTPEKNGKSQKKSGKRKNLKKAKVEPEATDEDEKSKKRYIPRYKKKIKSTGEEVEVTRTFNKKGRMEVITEGCKPVTVNQITEYFWPPISSLPPGEKPEGLMIQEQISEYLGVKSFKRKYPSIKRRPVDMEERNYLQENGYVSENMCDMGLTAVFSADIMEIMYNDFPHKFDEYRRYTREKKMKEQKALREKQAAENMDPRKEALESIVSWNTEFNSTRKFKVFHIDEKMRNESMGMPVSPFEKVLIVHAPVNVPLCIESLFWKNSIFSAECEVSTRSTQNMLKEYKEENKWIFNVGRLRF